MRDETVKKIFHFGGWMFEQTEFSRAMADIATMMN